VFNNIWLHINCDYWTLFWRKIWFLLRWIAPAYSLIHADLGVGTSGLRADKMNLLSALNFHVFARRCQPFAPSSSKGLAT